jgi:hypothetical protein
MTTDDETLRRYREASAALDERPAHAARASILAAAAREVGARPRAANAPRAVRMRWPLAAAAAVLLSTLAVMLASRTEHEMATFTAPEGSAPSSAPAAPIPAPAPPAAPAPDLSPAPATPKVEAPAARVQRPAETRAAPATVPRGEGPLHETRPRSVEAPAARDAERAPAAEPAPPPAPAAPAPMREAPSMRRDMAAESAKPSAAPMDLHREAADAAGPTVDLNAAQWLERIVQLRAAGRDDEADLELKRFAERYPQVQVPPAARGPTATR